MNNYEEYDEYEEELEEAPKKKKFNIFDWYFKREGKGEPDDINALEKPNITNFFKLAWRRLGKLMSANIIYIVANFPFFFIKGYIKSKFSQIF